MKKNNSEIITLLIILFAFMGCKNEPPTCKITSPINSAEFEQGEIVTISVDAEGTDGTITEVKFFINEIGVGTTTVFPYNHNWETQDYTPGTYTIKSRAIDDNFNQAEDEVVVSLLEKSSDGEKDNQTTVVDVTNPTTGKTWMDRNLGANRAAISSTDEEAYGDLYQWGREADGHQKRNSSHTTSLSTTDKPEHGFFILNDDEPYDWRSTQNDNLWQGVNGVNNPCPCGYRLPTASEWDAERKSWGSNNAAGAFASPLKLPVAGYRDGNNGSLIGVGSYGRCWASTVDGNDSRGLYFYSSDAGTNYGSRAVGGSVRCIKD